MIHLQRYTRNWKMKALCSVTLNQVLQFALVGQSLSVSYLKQVLGIEEGRLIFAQISCCQRNIGTNRSCKIYNDIFDTSVCVVQALPDHPRWIKKKSYRDAVMLCLTTLIEIYDCGMLDAYCFYIVWHTNITDYGFEKQSNAVIMNPLEPSKNVRYNRVLF